MASNQADGADCRAGAAERHGAVTLFPDWRRYHCRRYRYAWERPDGYPVPEACPLCGRSDGLSDTRTDQAAGTIPGTVDTGLTGTGK
jgi:hypothetical protein